MVPGVGVNHALGAKQLKADICHIDGLGAYHLISVNGHALRSHLHHVHWFSIDPDSIPALVCKRARAIATIPFDGERPGL